MSLSPFSLSANLPSLEVVREELRRREWALEPVRYFRERLGIDLTIWPVQAEIVNSVRDNRKTHVRSGHKVGKTTICAGLALWWLECFPNSRVVSTSGSWADLKLKLWGTINALYRRGGNWFGVECLDTMLRITPDHYGVGLSPNDVEPFAGHNAEHVLVIYDEASAIDQKFFDAGEAEATRMLATGNPLIVGDAFWRYSRDSEWRQFRLSCEDHPNVTSGKAIIPSGPSREWVEGRKQKWGVKSPLYLSRVAGEFPEESTDSWFPLSVIDACFKRYEPGATEEGSITLGLDVARAGGDHTIGYELAESDGLRSARKVIDLAKTEHHATRMIVMQRHQQRAYDQINVDAGGEGSGLADEASAAGLPVARILFGAESTDDECFNARTEMYRQLSIAMRGDMMIEPDSELMEELSIIGGTVKLKEKGGQALFMLAAKDEIKSHLGRSPDKADALALANYRPKTSGTGLLDYYRIRAEEMRATRMETP